MAASAWQVFNSFKKYLGDGTIDMDLHTFKVQLHSSTYVPNIATQTVRADLSGELATANGYTAGGKALTGVLWTQAGSETYFAAGNISWDAVGGALTARYAVIYDDTPTAPADPLVAYSLLDTTPADVESVAGTPLTLELGANIFYLTGGTG